MRHILLYVFEEICQNKLFLVYIVYEIYSDVFSHYYLHCTSSTGERFFFHRFARKDQKA